MFDIVTSYHFMQLQEKLMNQTWENSKTPSLGPDFGINVQNFGVEILWFWTYFYHNSIYEIIPAGIYLLKVHRNTTCS